LRRKILVAWESARKKEIKQLISAKRKSVGGKGSFFGQNNEWQNNLSYAKYKVVLR